MSATGAYEDREPGSRRRRIAGYLKAANDLRQNYQPSWTTRGLQNDGPQDLPGSYPGASISRGGDAQLILFPTYARRHVKRKPESVPGTIQQTSNYGRDVRDSTGMGDTEFWQREWEKHENDKAIVDVDIRGWIYAPQRGPMGRRNKVFMSMARQLSGIPAPRNSPSSSTTSSRQHSPTGIKDRLDSHTSRHQEEIARREAESVVRRGEAEAKVASQGGYSERPGRRQGDGSAGNSEPQSREASPERYHDEFVHHRRNQFSGGENEQYGAATNTSAQMSDTQIAAANANLLQRLAPFLAKDTGVTRISAFFFNDDASTMETVETDNNGHFFLRSALDFVPTQVRLLASEKMSKTQDVKIVEPHGINVISDIDDTIKHTAMLNGAKEIFRNVFVRDVGELSVEGVRDWYQQMAQLGCEFHYVSNSPWQLYPLLATFFENAGLPPGSFHLKAYSGMLQGIFEPVAERKRASIDKLMSDFPERRFILVGDSGEADLEVYRETVRDYPGRILGIFIRDVTTSKRRDFFDPASSTNTNNGIRPPPKPKAKPPDFSSYSLPKRASSTREDADLEKAIARSLADVGKPPHELERSLSRHQKTNSRSSPARPALPPRRPTAPAAPEENLIDLESDREERTESPDELPKDWLRPPPRPSKPRSLSSSRIERSASQKSAEDCAGINTGGKTPPPRPRKPSTSVHVRPAQTSSEKPPPLPLHSKPNSIVDSPDPNKPTKPPRPDPPPPRQSYRSAAKQKFSDVYNRMPSPKDMVFGSRPSTPNSSPTHSRAGSFAGSTSGRDLREPSLRQLIDEERGPPLPPRKQGSLQSSMRDSAAFLDDASLAYGDDDSIRQGSTGSTYGGYGNYNQQNGQTLSKKELEWRRRWREAREELEPKGIVLRSWRAGEDAQEDALALIQKASKDEHRGRKASKR